MTAATAVLRTMVREAVGPVVREAGFQGNGNAWRAVNAAGDWAVVSLESTGAEGSLRCAINLAVVPAPWLAWMESWLGTPALAVNESLGLYRDRLTPTGTPADAEGWWEIGSADEVESVARDMVSRLRLHGLPLLIRLLDRAVLVRSIQAGDLGMIRDEQFPGLFAFAEGVLIAENGPSARLDELLAHGRQQAPAEKKQSAADFAAWIIARAKTAR